MLRHWQKTKHMPLNEMIQLLQPLDGRLPSNLEEYDALVTRLRRSMHISQNFPGNVYESIYGYNRAHVGLTDEVQGQNDSAQVQVYHTNATATASRWTDHTSTSSSRPDNGNQEMMIFLLVMYKLRLLTTMLGCLIGLKLLTMVLGQRSW